MVRRAPQPGKKNLCAVAPPEALACSRLVWDAVSAVLAGKPVRERSTSRPPKRCLRLEVSRAAAHWVQHRSLAQPRGVCLRGGWPFDGRSRKYSRQSTPETLTLSPAGQAALGGFPMRQVPNELAPRGARCAPRGRSRKFQLRARQAVRFWMKCTLTQLTLARNYLALFAPRGKACGMRGNQNRFPPSRAAAPRTTHLATDHILRPTPWASSAVGTIA